jgi:nitrogen-specific signal transduction histidine kinase
MQESLIIDLVELAQEIDSRLKKGMLSRRQLEALAEEECLWLIALLDEKGIITFQHRPVSKDLLSLASPVVQGNEEIRISIFGLTESNEGVRFIALQRKSGSGTIILALDKDSFRCRSLRLSIQRAIEEVGQVSPQIEKKISQSENILKDGVDSASRKIVLNGQKLLEIIAPIRLGGGTDGTARLSLRKDSADRILDKIRFRVFVSMAFMVVIAFVSMWFLYKNQNRHLARMREMERRLQKAERLSALGRLAAGVAHEIRNPLNAISMASQRLKKDNLNQDEIRRLNHIIEEFLGLSRSRKLEFCRHDLTELLHHIVLLIGEEANSEGVAIHTDFKNSPFMISMDMDKLKQALFNIIKNAMESISPTGSINLSVEPRGKEWVSVKISDTGTGLTSEEIEKIFDPDYTTKEKGLGLGLPLAHEIIHGHGGEIQVQSRPGSGTTFEILLPLDREVHSS